MVILTLLIILTAAGCEVDQQITPPEKVSVFFYTDGGSAVSTQEIEKSEYVPQPPDPIKTGYDFVSWYAEPELSTKWNFTFDTVSSDMVLYAKWTERQEKIFAGDFDTFLLKPSGVLWATGSNIPGNLGTGTNTNISTPVIITDDVVSIAPGASHTMVLTSDGKLYGTGENGQYQLCDGTDTDQNSLHFIMDDVADVFAGGDSTFILKIDGSLLAGGDNTYGQLGNGTPLPYVESPVYITDRVKKVAASDFFSLILKTDGSLYGTGYNLNGELGDGTNTNRSTPVFMMDGVADIAAGEHHSVILKTSGALLVTGYNYYGQLSIGTDGPDSDISTPRFITDEVTSIAAGRDFTMIIKEDGNLYASGRNNFGQLGDGTLLSKTRFELIKTDVTAVSCGDLHSVIITDEGKILTSGRNDDGELGTGTTTDSLFYTESLF